MTEEETEMPNEDPTFTIPPDDDISIMVRDDIVAGLERWFEPDDQQFFLRDDVHAEGMLSNGPVTAVAWRYEANAKPDEWGVAARGPIRIDGATFVNAADGDPVLSRYIDWHGVFQQLGVASAGRVTDEQI
jgi:hypothetical protein